MTKHTKMKINFNKDEETLEMLVSEGGQHKNLYGTIFHRIVRIHL